MGTIVYGNLVELILREGGKTESEIIKEAIERFGFKEYKLPSEIRLQLLIKEKTGFVSKDGDEKYRLLKYNNGFSGRKDLLRILNEASKEYFENNPCMFKLKNALEEAELKR